MMLNVLGDGDMASTKAVLTQALSVPGAAVHWYGKAEARIGRKVTGRLRFILFNTTYATKKPSIAAILLKTIIITLINIYQVNHTIDTTYTIESYHSTDRMYHSMLTLSS
jgi:Phosphoribosylaminoimidazole carboxylase C-terminal domain